MLFPPFLAFVVNAVFTLVLYCECYVHLWAPIISTRPRFRTLWYVWTSFFSFLVHFVVRVIYRRLQILAHFPLILLLFAMIYAAVFIILMVILNFLIVKGDLTIFFRWSLTLNTIISYGNNSHDINATHTGDLIFQFYFVCLHIVFMLNIHIHLA